MGLNRKFRKFRRRRRTGSRRSPPRRVGTPKWAPPKSPGWAPQGRAAPPDHSPSGAAATFSLASPAAAAARPIRRVATKKWAPPKWAPPRRRRAPRSRRASPPPPPPPSPTRPTPRRSSSDRGRSDGSGGSRRISSRHPAPRGVRGGRRRRARRVARGTRSPNPSTASWTRCRSTWRAITCAWRTRRRLCSIPRGVSPRKSRGFEPSPGWRPRRRSGFLRTPPRMGSYVRRVTSRAAGWTRSRWSSRRFACCSRLRGTTARCSARVGEGRPGGDRGAAQNQARWIRPGVPHRARRFGEALAPATSTRRRRDTRR